jgi:hypothetical protein
MMPRPAPPPSRIPFTAPSPAAQVPLTEPETNLLRTLRANDLSGNPIGLNALAVCSASERHGHPVDMRVGDINRLIAKLRDRGLVRSAPRHHGRSTFRLTDAGFAAISHIPTTQRRREPREPR